MNFNCEIKLANCLKHIVLLCVCAAFLFSSISRAQDQAANWYFGARAGVNFDNNNVSAILNSELSTHEGCASISNAKGELLFYTNGVSVWDKDHKVMPNGTDLMGNISSSQSAIIVPKPNSETVYYIFTIIDYAYTEGLRYSEVDMSLNGGNGDVTLNKNVFLISPGTEKISAVQHSNGIDYWVSTHLWESNSFATFKITENGVETTPVLSAVGSYHGGASFNVIGCMKFSPNGKKLALTKWSTDSFVELFDFDKETGIISNPVLIDNFFGADYLNGAYGIEFSTDSKLLYVSELNQKDYTSELHQLDLTVFTPTAIKASGALINKEQRLIAGLQLGPDGKIYVSNTFSTFLSVIEAPNTKGIGCNYQNRNIDLKGRSSIFGLPSFIQSFFIGKIEVENVCFNDAVDFNLITSEAIDDVLWEFGDGETSTLLHPDHTYKAVGDYLVKATFKSGNCNYTVSKGFTVYESPIANTVSDYVICKDIGDDDFEIFDLSSKTKEIIGLQSNSIFDVAYFKSYDDATDGVNILNSSYTNTSNFQDIYFKISNTLNPDCYSVSSFKLIIETEKAGVPEDFVLCDDLSNDGKVKVDLSQFDADVYNGSLKTSYSVNYYTSQLDADIGGKSFDPLSFETTSNNQDIFARLENTVTGCYSTSSFKIITNKLPIAGTAGDLILCDDASNDGKATVDLKQFNAAIFNGALQTEHQVTYYTSQGEADLGGTGLNATSFETSSANQEVFARLENTATGCFTTSSFKIIINAMPTAYPVQDLFLCDDSSNNGKAFFNLGNQTDAILNGQTGRVTYHASQAEADSNANKLPENYENQNPSEEIFARVESVINTACYAVTSFKIQLNKLPIAGTAGDLILCDDASNDGKATVDLTQFNAAIFNGALQTEHQVTYYTSQAEADFGGTGLNATSFETSSNDQEVFARLENITTGCFTTSSFKIIINAMPTAYPVQDLFLCDDSSNNGKAFFNLGNQTDAILNGQTGRVTYHASPAEADSNANKLPENYENQNPSEEIFARVESVINTACYAVTSFKIQLNKLPIAGTAGDLILCDDASNDGKATVDLTQFNGAIFNGALQTEHQVTYYTSQAEADLGGTGLNETSFETSSTNQEVFARLENITTGCFTTSSFKIIINAMPTAYPVQDLFLCDDSSNNGKAFFNLGNQTDAILNGQAGRVTYHASQAEADSNANKLPENYENQNPSEEIFARVESVINTACYAVISFEIQLNKLPIAGTAGDLILCDDASNDGKATVDLTQFNAAIFNGALQTEHQVTYYTSQGEADLGGTGLNPTSFETSSTNQEVFARLENTTTGCFTTSSFKIIINAMPTAYPVQDLFLCDDLSNNGKAFFNLGNQTDAILNGQAGRVTYHLSQAEADSNANKLPKNYENQNPSEEIFARVELLSNTLCYAVTSFFIRLNNQPIIDMDAIWYLCPGETIQLYVNSLHDEYVWSTGERGSDIIVDEAGDYTVTVYNVDRYNSKCDISKTVKVVAAHVPQSVNVEVNDWTTNSNSVVIEAAGEGEFKYSLDGNIYTSSNSFDNLDAGDYTVYIRNENDCIVYTKDIYLLNYPKFFTPNNDGYHDYWRIEFAESEPDLEINIFDRYGKLIIQLNPYSKGWDGTLNGHLLATSDYWFVVNRPSKNRQYHGHFTLKR